ncbi:hypothetical protein [Vibrio alfacsensis]|uniref:hypothetical protein n=1 Tax=Vibrio alfacsensis TaxID=1074311 RepID=UPI001C813F4B|nr:hypothetical protein [Vibrio alfacsensis]
MAAPSSHNLYGTRKMAEKIIAAFETGKPVKLEKMSWAEFIIMLDKIGTQTGRSSFHKE